MPYFTAKYVYEPQDGERGFLFVPFSVAQNNLIFMLVIDCHVVLIYEL